VRSIGAFAAAIWLASAAGGPAVACTSTVVEQAGGGDPGQGGTSTVAPCDEVAPSVPTYACLTDPHWTCDSLPKPCADTMLDMSAPGGPAFVDRAAAACALDRLRAREPARLTLVAWNFPAECCSRERQEIWLLGGASAEAWVTSEGDLGASCHSLHRQALRPPEHFASCIDEVDDEGLFACLWEFSEGCGDVEATCPP